MFRKTSRTPQPMNDVEKPRKRKEQFILFKPLFAIALSAIAYELLPIDFQHYLAPSLVSYEEVFFANRVDGHYALTKDDLLADRLTGEELDRMRALSLN